MQPMRRAMTIHKKNIFIGLFTFASSFSSIFSISTQASSSNTSTKRIFCYGDSLTAGTSPPLPNTYPYAKHLQQSLEALTTTKTSKKIWEVNWYGLPGWTAASMVENIHSNHGLIHHLKTYENQNQTPDLVIVLSGTNDLAYPSQKDPVGMISTPIIHLHQAAHAFDIPTFAISIPPSAWQARSKDAHMLASNINACVQEFCNSSNHQATFISFPIDAYSDKEKDVDETVWAPDGLHFSPKGYQILGESLAHSVGETFHDWLND